MFKNICCSICLTTNKRTINIYKTDLQYVYENLANYKIRGNECWMCYICHTRLWQCHRLQQLAVQTRGLIYDLYQKKNNISFGGFESLLELSILNNENISTTHTSLLDIKQESDVKRESTNDDVIEEYEIVENTSNCEENEEPSVVLEDPLLVSDACCKQDSLNADRNDAWQGSKVLELKIVRLSQSVIDKYVSQSPTTHTVTGEYHEDRTEQTAALCADKQEEINLEIEEEIGDKNLEPSPIHSDAEFKQCMNDLVNDGNVFSDTNEPVPEESISAAEETQIITRGESTSTEISSPILSPIPDHEDPYDNEFCTIYLEAYATRPNSKTPSTITGISTDVTPTTLKVFRKKTYVTADVGKKRLVNKEHWCDVQRKKLKNEGKSYTNKRGKKVAEKELGQPCEKKCRYKCTENFDRKQREVIFSKFWKLGDRNRHWEFVIKYTKKNNKRRKTTETTKHKREYTFIYYLPTTEKETKRVCKKMFLSTISSGERIVRTAWKKYDGMTGVEEDRRGKYDHKPRVIDEVMVQSIKDHVYCIDRVESYYACKDSKKLYFNNIKSISQMYKLYVEWYDPKTYTNQANERQYRDIVNANFNINFHKPKKDLREVREQPVPYRRRKR